MALFPKPEESDENQEIIAQLVARLNDVDRRLRIAEQAISNQKLNINNLNENFVNNRKDTERTVGSFDERIEGFNAKIAGIERQVQEMAEALKKMPSSSELAELKTKSILSSEIGKGGTDLDTALNALEKHGGSLEEELK